MNWPGLEDAAMPPERVPVYLREFHDHGYQTSRYGHFDHGCIHCRISFDLYTEEGIRNWGEPFVRRTQAS